MESTSTVQDADKRKTPLVANDPVPPVVGEEDEESLKQKKCCCLFLDGLQDDLKTWEAVKKSDAEIRVQHFSDGLSRKMLFCFVCGKASTTHQEDRVGHFRKYHLPTLTKAIPYPSDEDVEEYSMFLIRYFMGFGDELRSEGVVLKDLNKVVSRLGSRSSDYIRDDFRVGMVVYFRDSPPFFICSLEEFENRDNYTQRAAWNLKRNVLRKHIPVKYEHGIAWRMGEAAARRAIKSGKIKCSSCLEECSCFYTYTPRRESLCQHGILKAKCAARSCFST